MKRKQIISQLLDCLDDNSLEYKDEYHLLLEENTCTLKSSKAHSPKLICVAGIPGSGKTTYIQKTFSKSEYIIIDTDLFRKYFPQYHKLTHNDVVMKTQQFSDKAADLMLEFALKTASSIVLADTFINVDFWCNYFDAISVHFEKLHYKKEFIVLSQPKEECLKALKIRSDNSSVEEPVSRPFDIAFFEDKWSLFDNSTKDILDLGFFDSCTFLARKSLEEEYK